MSADVVIVKTGAANLASVVAAFDRLGRSVQVTDNAFAVRNARRVVLPGVGAFAPVAKRLRENGMGEAVLHRVEQDMPLLAVCLGLHLLAVGSEEGEDAEGLGVLEVRASRYPDTVVVPQLGWNTVSADSDCRLLQTGAVDRGSHYVDGVDIFVATGEDVARAEQVKAELAERLDLGRLEAHGERF